MEYNLAGRPGFMTEQLQQRLKGFFTIDELARHLGKTHGEIITAFSNSNISTGDFIDFAGKRYMNFTACNIIKKHIESSNKGGDL